MTGRMRHIPFFDVDAECGANSPTRASSVNHGGVTSRNEPDGCGPVPTSTSLSWAERIELLADWKFGALLLMALGAAFIVLVVALNWLLFLVTLGDLA